MPVFTAKAGVRRCGTRCAECKGMGRIQFATLLLCVVSAALPACGSADGEEIVSADEITSGGSAATAAPDAPSPAAPFEPGADSESAAQKQDATAAALPSCVPSTCAAPAALNPGDKRGFDHLSSQLISRIPGGDQHRGRDQIYTEGEPQWVIGKFTYSLVDKDLEDEEVDVFVERGCKGAWQKLGTTRTGSAGRKSVDGVNDEGGRVLFQIPKGKELAIGRHRVRMVVAGDHTSADALIDVVPDNSDIVVSDVDGTLTSSENAEYPALLTGNLPDANPDAAKALSTLAAKGFRIVYLTARPEFLTDRTREFLAERGFPLGIVHTTTTLTGALNGAAAEFKSGELQRLKAHGLNIKWAFGNKDSDATAYQHASIDPKNQRVFLKLTDPNGGRRIEKYSDILPAVNDAKAVCK